SPKATVDFRRIMLKRLTHTGSTLRARSIPDKGAIARAVEEHVLPLIAAGRVGPLVDSTFPLAQAAAAHARMETSAHVGKIVLTIATSWNSYSFSSPPARGAGPGRPRQAMAGREIDVTRRKVLTRLGRSRNCVSPAMGSTGVKLGGRRLQFVRGCVTAMLTMIVVGLSPARAVEAINVRTDAQAIDL